MTSLDSRKLMIPLKSFEMEHALETSAISRGEDFPMSTNKLFQSLLVLLIIVGLTLVPGFPVRAETTASRRITSR